MASLYRVGITLLLTDGVSAGLSRISHQLLGVHASAGQINNQFGKWALAIGGAGSIMAGTKLLHGMKTVANHGEKLLDQQDKLIRAGRTQAEVANLTADAYSKITKMVPTAKASDVLRVANELTLVKGNFADAAKAAAGALKLEALVGNATGKPAEGQGYNVWRALELKGVTLDHDLTDKIMGKLTAMIIGSAGKISGSEIFNFARQAGPAWQNADMSALEGVIPYLIQEIRGEKAGTGYQRMYNAAIGTRRWTKSQYKMWNDLGLIDPTKVTTDRGGGVNLAPGAVKGVIERSGDMQRVMEELIRPALLKKGLTDPKMVTAYLGKMFPDSTAARVASIIWQQLDNIEKDRKNIAGAKPLDAAYTDYIKNNPMGVKQAFHAQYESMMEAIGAPLMKAALPVMIGVTNMFNSIGEFASTHPDAMKWIGIGIVAIGAALISAGGVALLAAIGPVGWIAAGITALGVVLMSVDWTTAWGKFMDGMRGIWKWANTPLWGSAPPDSPAGGASAAPPGKQSSLGGGQGDVYLDGVKVGVIVSKHQADSASGPLRSGSMFDGTMDFIPTGYNFARG